MYTKIMVLFSYCMIMHASLMSMNHDFVLGEIVVRHVDYDMHRQFAMVSKACNKTVENTYRPKKKLIEKWFEQEKPRITGHISWNRDFSRCAWVTVSDKDMFTLRNLQLTLVGLNDKNDIESSSELWRLSYCPVFEDNIRPFFDKEGRACFYNDYCGIYEYSVDLNNSAECCNCLYEVTVVKNITSYDKWYDFSTILCLPILLKAFLQSKQIRKETIEGVDYKIHNIAGVIIPKDYKTARGNKTFDSLEWELQRAIEKKYREQQREKMLENKKIEQGGF